MNIKLPDEWVRRINRMLRSFEGGGTPPPPAIDGGLLPSSGKIIRIKNNSGAAVVAGGVLGLDGPLITPTNSADSDNLSHFWGQIIFKGIIPTITTHFTSFAVALQPIGVGGTGAACVGGICQAKVNIVNTTHLYANVINSSTASLKSAGSGLVRILAKPESGTGVKYALVDIDLNTHRLPVKLTQTGGSAGTSSAQCSFTYTAKTLDAGDTIATAVGLIGNRAIKAEMTAATYGEIGKDSAGAWKIFWCDEQMNNDPC